MSIKSPSNDHEEYEADSPHPFDPYDVGEKCRLCLKGSDVLIPVYSGDNPENYAVSAVALKIDILTTVKVGLNDKICTVCRLKVKRFYSFRVMCLKSDERIRQAAINDETSFRPGPTEGVRSYQKPKRFGPVDVQNKLGNDALSIIPMPRSESQPIKTESKVSSGLTISAVPLKREPDSNENGHEWNHDNNYGSNESSNMGDGTSQECSSPQGEETENLEVQIDPFMLMEDYASDHEQPPQQNSIVNVRGQILYPVLGNNTQIPPPQPRPRPLPLSSGGDAERQRAIELIKQMTRSKNPSPDGSFLEKPFKCDVCPESFSYYKSFVKHKQRHTGELQPLKCEFCPDVFQTSRQLQNHLKYHNVEKAFPCDQCERSFPTKERLQSHYSLHTGNKPWVCEICHKSFAYKSSYGLHIRKQHGEQPIKSQSFKCNRCHEEFNIFVDFKRHLRTHVEEKPFTCVVCNKAFASRSILNVHSRIHNGLRPYKCEVCQQAFTQKQSLDYHMRRHNEENPFKCEYCGMTFQRKYFLDKHKETQHGVGASAVAMSAQRTESTQRVSSVIEAMVDEIEHNVSQTAAEDDDDDDMDSDPLKLEIDETSIKLEGDESEDGNLGKSDLEMFQ